MINVLLFILYTMNPLNEVGHSDVFPFDPNKPDVTFEMPTELKEISGLSIDKASGALIAIQDENGIVFMLDINTGKLIEKVPFRKDGDYEGIEVVNGTYYILNSAGSVFHIENFRKPGQTTTKFNDFLDGESDVEGFGYDSKSNSLLLACKEETEGHSHEDAKCIYSFSLADMKLNPKPAFVLKRAAVKTYLDANPPIYRLEKLKAFFSKDEFKFSPSGLAFHPASGHLYILSSAGKMLLVLNRENEVIHIAKLDKAVHAQPEGICFDHLGNLFISNEGKDGGAGVIYKFIPRS